MNKQKNTNRIAGIICITTIIIHFFFVSAIGQHSCCTPGRFEYQIFDSVTVVRNLHFKTAPDFELNPVELRADVYMPEDDSCTERPLCVFIFGGGFYTGSRNGDLMVSLCDTFARKGYVTAAIDYRLGFYRQQVLLSMVDYPSIYDSEEALRSVWRATQDTKSAIKYLKANAATFGIDTSKVFVGGGSAGAITALHTAYMDEWERPPGTYAIDDVEYLTDNFPFVEDHSRPDLGTLDNAAEYPGFSSRVHGALSFAGAVGDTSIIEGPDLAPLIIFHEDEDPVVPFGHDYPYLGLVPNYDKYFGGQPISVRADNIGLYNRFFPFEGNCHCPDPYIDIVLEETTDFFLSILCPACVSDIVIDANANPVSGLYTAGNTITVQGGVLVITGESLILDAPDVILEPDFETQPGAELEINQPGCGGQ